MDKPKFTPGPWAYRRVESPEDGMPRLVYCQIGPAERLGQGGSVAYAGTYGKTVRHQTGGPRQSDEECDANAALMAAAPRLYQAAELALDLLPARGGLHTPTGRLRSLLQSALAEARGEQ